MLGLLDDARLRTPAGFRESGDRVLLLGDTGDCSLGGSAYLAERGYVVGPLPAFDLEREVVVQRLCRELIRRGVVRSAHDLSDGGLGVALAEGCLLGGLGLVVEWFADGEPFGPLFNEAQSR